MRLSQLLRGESTISIIGLAKNTGKTVSLNQLIRELDESKRRIGVTSVGRDGERTDVLDSAIVKPPIHLPLGTLFTSTPQLLQRADVRYRILHRTQIRTPLGTLVVGLVTAPGQLEVTGPPSFAPLQQIRDLMHRLGADLVLIDGAFDRKAAASPEISDGVILSTGAVLSPDPDDVVQITRSRVEMLRLPTVTDPLVREVAQSDGRVLGIGCDSRVHRLPFDPLCDAIDTLAKVIPHDLAYMVFRNALVESMIDRISESKPGDLPTFVVQDSSHLFVSPAKWREYRARGLRFQALRAIHLIATTVNPVAPAAHRLSSEELVGKLRIALSSDNVFDVRSPRYPATLGHLTEPQAIAGPGRSPS